GAVEPDVAASTPAVPVSASVDRASSPGGAGSAPARASAARTFDARLLFTYTVASLRNSRMPLSRSCCWRNFAKASSASVPPCHNALSLYPLVEWRLTTASYAATTLRTSARTEAGASGLDSAVRTVFSRASASLYIVRAGGAAYAAEAASVTQRTIRMTMSFRDPTKERKGREENTGR